MNTRTILQTEPTRFPRVRDWAEEQFQKGASLGATAFAVSIPSFAETLADCCEVDLSQFPVPPGTRLNRWHEFWRSPATAWMDLLQETDAEWIPSEMTHLFDPKLATFSISRRRAIGRWMQMQSRLCTSEFLNQLDHITSGLTDKDLDGWSLDRNDSLLFLVRIYFPALARFGLPPETIYQQATAGDYQALERILALDPTTESLPEVRQVLWERVQKRKPSPLHCERLHTVRTLGFSRKSCKSHAIAWCRDWSRLLAKLGAAPAQDFCRGAFGVDIKAGRVFTVPDLQRLFDAYSLDRNGYIDADLTGSTEALKKMVDRCADSFPLQHWDIFSAFHVPLKRGRAA